MSFRPEEVPRVYRLLEVVQEGCPCHGPIHALIASAGRVGFRWDPCLVRRGGVLPVLSDLAGPLQHFRSATLHVWRCKVSADLCARSGFRRAPLLDIDGSYILAFSHVREMWH